MCQIAFKNSIDGLNFTVAQGSSSSVDVTVKGAKDIISKIKKEELQDVCRSFKD